MIEWQLIIRGAACMGFIMLVGWFHEGLSMYLMILAMMWTVNFLAEARCLRKRRDEQAKIRLEMGDDD
jgi:hypothetical protein